MYKLLLSGSELFLIQVQPKTLLRTNKIRQSKRLGHSRIRSVTVENKILILLGKLYVLGLLY